MRRAAWLALLLAALVVPAPANAAPPNPFGHSCTPQDGVLFCPTADLSQRVASFDGTPIDVDVTLPAQGDGPFPTIVMLHGLGGTKHDFESADPNGKGGETYHYNNVFYAQHGYAVVNASARGWGNSCGVPSSRTSPGCDRSWIQLADQAYEARDAQTLVGMLVDEGVTRPDAIGVTGVSYGGGQTNELAFLRNRIRMTDGTLVPWASPHGTPLHVAAAWSRWGWSDLSYALAPNGRFLETRAWTPEWRSGAVGIEKRSFVGGFYLLATALGFVAPAGADPNADLTTAKQISDRGEPFPASLKAWIQVQTTRKSAASLFGSTPAPLLVENGWTDDVFPAPEALRIYRMTNYGRLGPVALQLGDLGHGRGANKPNEEQFLNDQGASFFDAYLKHAGTPPAAGSATAFTQTCPKTAPAGGPFRASSWAKLHPGALAIAGAKRQTVLSSSFNRGGSKIGDQVIAGDACAIAPAGRVRGTAVYSRKVRRGFTMLGLPLVRAKVQAKGRFGQLDAHLYDVFHGKLTLITRGGYRLTPNQHGTIAFELNGNAYRFAKGHTVELEVTGRDPNYARPSNGTFRVTLSSLTVSIPTRERKPA